MARILRSDDRRGQTTVFFASVATPFRNSLDSRIERNDCERYLIDKEIVCELIGGFLFHPDDVSGVTQTKTTSIFKSIEDDGDSSSDQSYVAVIRTGKRFQFCAKFISCGASFRMASKLVQHVKDETGIAYYGGCSDSISANYIRFVCASGLQILSTALKSSRVFSIAVDSSTHQGHSYLDTRVRFCVGSVLYNFHLLAIPLYDRHTGEEKFLTLKKDMYALFKG
jgi:hypothetical protein